jgi:hypothetical protein
LEPVRVVRNPVLAQVMRPVGVTLAAEAALKVVALVNQANHVDHVVQ